MYSFKISKEEGYHYRAVFTRNNKIFLIHDMPYALEPLRSLLILSNKRIMRAFKRIRCSPYNPKCKCFAKYKCRNCINNNREKNSVTVTLKNGRHGSNLYVSMVSINNYSFKIYNESDVKLFNKFVSYLKTEKLDIILSDDDVREDWYNEFYYSENEIQKTKFIKYDDDGKKLIEYFESLREPLYLIKYLLLTTNIKVISIQIEFDCDYIMYKNKYKERKEYAKYKWQQKQLSEDQRETKNKANMYTYLYHGGKKYPSKLMEIIEQNKKNIQKIMFYTGQYVRVTNEAYTQITIATIDKEIINAYNLAFTNKYFTMILPPTISELYLFAKNENNKQINISELNPNAFTFSYGEKLHFDSIEKLYIPNKWFSWLNKHYHELLANSNERFNLTSL